MSRRPPAVAQLQHTPVCQPALRVARVHRGITPAPDSIGTAFSAAIEVPCGPPASWIGAVVRRGWFTCTPNPGEHLPPGITRSPRTAHRPGSPTPMPVHLACLPAAGGDPVRNQRSTARTYRPRRLIPAWSAQHEHGPDVAGPVNTASCAVSPLRSYRTHGQSALVCSHAFATALITELLISLTALRRH